MLRASLVPLFVILFCASSALAAEAPAEMAPQPEPAPAVETPELTEPAVETTPECSEPSVDGEEKLEFTGFFGPHCTRPSFTCNLVEPGLGFDCTCTYRCECAYCHGQLTQINCVLIENDGCFACPLPAS